MVMAYSIVRTPLWSLYRQQHDGFSMFAITLKEGVGGHAVSVSVRAQRPVRPDRALVDSGSAAEGLGRAAGLMVVPQAAWPYRRLLAVTPDAGARSGLCTMPSGSIRRFNSQAAIAVCETLIEAGRHLRRASAGRRDRASLRAERADQVITRVPISTMRIITSKVTAPPSSTDTP